MNILNPSLMRKDPISPLVKSNNKQNIFKKLSDKRDSFDLDTSYKNFSFVKEFSRKSNNKIRENRKTPVNSLRQTSTLSDLTNENRKTNYSFNNITVIGDNIFSNLNNTNVLKNGKKKKVKFLHDENLVKIILVESYKKYHKIDEVMFDDNIKDIDKLKVLKQESLTTYSNTKDLSPIKVNGNKNKTNNKLNPKKKNFMYSEDKACKCSLF